MKIVEMRNIPPTKAEFDKQLQTAMRRARRERIVELANIGIWVLVAMLSMLVTYLFGFA